jgi:quinol monooxygenase YgiN
VAFVCSATWVALKGKESLVRDALKELSIASRTEVGNLYYQGYQDPLEPRTFRIFEVYTDEAAFKAHGEQGHFKRWALGQAIPALESRVREFYETLEF